MVYNKIMDYIDEYLSSLDTQERQIFYTGTVALYDSMIISDDQMEAIKKLANKYGDVVL